VTTRSAALLTGLGMSTASMALMRLAAEGLVTRIKRGAWLIGPAAAKPAALVAAAAQPYEAYLSGWSALRHHGRLQQFPETHFGVTLGRPSEVIAAGAIIALRHINPSLFTGYTYEATADGLVASPEKALFDVAYFSAMNRRPMSGTLPETDLEGFRWSELQGWLRRITNPGIRTKVERNLSNLREQHSGMGRLAKRRFRALGNRAAAVEYRGFLQKNPMEPMAMDAWESAPLADEMEPGKS
jgi:predicted transcriptional regulator of viral defense system